MRRDPDLLRDILLTIEAAPGAELLRLPRFEDHAPNVIRAHVRLLIEAGLVHAVRGPINSLRHQFDSGSALALFEY